MLRVIQLFLVINTVFSSDSKSAYDLGTSRRYSFEINYENDEFLLDGEPFRYVSGSFHYFRTPSVFWRDRLRKMRAAGLNAVSTYVEWSLHEPRPDEWNWSGDADITEFLRIAQEEDLLVLLRPGPYICAERDLGGFPTWLLSDPQIELRSNDNRYMTYVQRYLENTLRRIEPFLRGNGGPIIMVQIENEYGSYHTCDTQYLSSLKGIFEKHIKSRAVLYTTDGTNESMLKCGSIPGVYTTVDFGTGANVTTSFQLMRKFQSKGPLVNSEFYPGWLTHWEEEFQTVSTPKVVRALEEILSLGASVNMYMFYGGTNFAFTSGADADPDFRPQITSYDYDAPLTEAGDPTLKYFVIRDLVANVCCANTDPAYRPHITSYDYDAPLTEAGDFTPKYFAIRDVIANYLPLPNIPTPAAKVKITQEELIVEPVIRLLEPLGRKLLSSISTRREIPPTFEELQLPLQLVVYETFLPARDSDVFILEAVVHDRAYVFIDQQLIGILSRTHEIFSLPLTLSDKNHLLSILVENQGHINYGNFLKDYKGIWNVILDEIPLSNWNVTGFCLNDMKSLKNLENTNSILNFMRGGPIFFRSEFNINSTPTDTFLNTRGWGKGVAYINGYNLGRYWPLVGPQITLYVPSSYLNQGKNEIIILEYENFPKSRSLKLQTYPEFDFKS